MQERHKVKVAVMVILERENEILLTRRVNTGWEDGKYTVPSGHLEHEETPLVTAIRETKEEVGVELDSNNLTLVHVDFFDNYLHLYFKASEWKGEPKIMEPDKCDELIWADYENLPSNIAGHGFETLDAIAKKVHYSEYSS